MRWKIEALRSKLRGIFDRKDFLSVFDSLANPEASSGECARYCGSKEQVGLKKDSVFIS